MNARVIVLGASAIMFACAFAATSLAQTPAGHAVAPAPGKPRAGVPKKKPAAAAPDKKKPGAKPTATEPASEAAPPSASAPTPAGPRAPHEVVERESRIEFDERMVRGQTAAGAIYLFQRAPTEFKSIVQVPESFRTRTTGMLTSRRASP